MRKKTIGDQNRCECPVCGKMIHDLWDLGNSLVAGNTIDCPRCGAEVDIVEVDTLVTVVLQERPV